MVPAPVARGPMFKVGVAPGVLPLVGHAFRLGRKRLQFAASLPSYGDLVLLRIGPLKVYVVCHPELVRQMLAEDRVFDKGGLVYDKLRGLIGNGVGSCTHATHRRQRRLVQPAFHHERIPRYAEVMTQQISAALDTWRDQAEMDALVEMHAITTSVTTRTLFAADVGAEKTASLYDDLTTIMHGVYRHVASPAAILGNLPTPGNRRFERARVRLRATIEGIVEDYRHSGRDHADLLSMLLAARDENDRSLSDEEIHDEVITFFIGGADTTARTLAWCIHLLATHPEIEARLWAEVDAVLGGRIAQWQDAEALELTRRIITEALRLFPPPWLITRVATEDTSLAGHPIAAGTTVAWSSYIVHRNADYFPDPERFNPDRWLAERAAQIPREAFVAFGGGARKCIGDVFGMTEATLALSSLAGRWRIRPTRRARLNPAPEAMLGPEFLHVQLERRHPEAEDG